METVEVLDTFKIANLDKIAAYIQFQKGVTPEIGSTFITTDKKKIKIIGIEMFPLGSNQQLKKWNTDRTNGKFSCTIEFV